MPENKETAVDGQGSTPNERLDGPATCAAGPSESSGFTGRTKIATLEWGSVAIAEVVGTRVTVRCRDGAWRVAKAINCGEQPVRRYFLGGRTGNLSTTHPTVIDATMDHRWLLANGSETTSLRIGDVLAAARMPEEADLEGTRHGLVFGDGTAHKRRMNYADGFVSQGRNYCSIRLCGNDKKYLPLFDGYSISYPPHAKGDPVVYVGKKPCWKEVPFSSDPGYLRGFIIGWWLADGSKTYNRGMNAFEISTTNETAKGWLLDYAGIAGYAITGVSVHHRKSDDGSFANGKPLFSVRFCEVVSSPRCVKKIEDFEHAEEVYCLEEPVTGTFVLGNGILTCSS